jgi:hypothetical protein
MKTKLARIKRSSLLLERACSDILNFKDAKDIGIDMDNFGATTLSITTLSIMTFSIMTLNIMKFNITTLSITTLSITTLRITTFCITTFSKMTLSIKGLFEIFRVMTLTITTLYNFYCYAECHDAECR